MLTIGYITNIKLNETSGGGSGVNNASFHQLSKHFNISAFEPINPAQDISAKLISKLSQCLDIPGNYHFFSEKRLSLINNSFQYQYALQNNLDILFFHGFTPWIKTKPSIPYFSYNDACFATYVDIYNARQRFNPKDLERIYTQEARWLSSAEKVFFRSQWALEETCKHYNINGDNFINVGLGGFIEIPEQDTFRGNRNFLFISKEFKEKGGRIVLDAFRKVSSEHDNIKLWIVGAPPPDYVASEPNVTYLGFFNKEKKEDINSLKEIFAQSFALLHPTKKDTNTLVITELAYFGCPAISSNRFAIPEYIKDGVTGFLLNNPDNSEELADKMRYIINNPEHYNALRKNSRNYAITNNTWDIVGKRLYHHISSHHQ